MYDLSVKPEEGLNFGTVNEGYKDLPEAQTVTVTNTGNTKITLQQPTGKNYTVGALSQTELEAGKSATFTVQPKKGLSKEEYLDLGTVSLGMDEEKFGEISGNIGEDYDLLIALRGLYDWSVLADILNGHSETISMAKVQIYEQHGKDL